MDEMVPPVLLSKMLLDRNTEIWNEGAGTEVQKKQKKSVTLVTQ